MATVYGEKYELGAVATSGEPRINTLASMDTPEADDLSPARFVPTRGWSVERDRQIAPLFLGGRLRGFSGWSELTNRQPGCSSVGPHSAGTPPSDAAARATTQKRPGDPLTGIRSKRPRLKLEPAAYRQLCHEVLERDGWRCQSSGQIEGLQVHHIQPRSRRGHDRAENLIAFRVMCLQKAHRLRQDTEPDSRTHRQAEPVVFQQGRSPTRCGGVPARYYDVAAIKPPPLARMWEESGSAYIAFWHW